MPPAWKVRRGIYSPCTENFYISILSYPTSYIQHPTSYIQHPASYIQHPTSYIQYPASYIQHPTSSILHPTSSILHPTSSILHPASSTLHSPSYIKILSNPILSYPIQSYPAKIFKIILIETKKLRLLGFKGVYTLLYIKWSEIMSEIFCLWINIHVCQNANDLCKYTV